MSQVSLTQPPSGNRRPTRTVVQIMHFVPHSLRSVQLFWLSLAEQLVARGWRTIYVFAGEPGDEFRKHLRRLQSPYLLAEFPLTNRAAANLGRDLRQYCPDVLQTAYLSTFSWTLRTLKKESGARLLVVNDRSSGLASRRGFVGRLLARLRGALGTSHIDRVIAVSDFVRRRNIGQVYLSASKVRTIHNGVDVTEYAPAIRVDNAVFTVGYVGQLIPEKGPLTLLRAVGDLEAEGASVQLVLAGIGHQRCELEQFCADNGLAGVEFLGQIDWVNRLLTSVDVAVFPSEWEEAFGFAVLEALASGACVLASDAGGIPEVVGAGGEAGLLFRKGDVGDLKQKLRELMNDPDRRERMRTAARARAVRQFSLERMVSEYLAVFDELDLELRS